MRCALAVCLLVLAHVLAPLPALADDPTKTEQSCVRHLYCVVTHRFADDRWEIWAVSRTEAPTTIGINLAATNMDFDGSDRHAFVLPGGERTRIWTLRRGSDNRRSGFRFTFSHHYGAETRDHDDRVVYRLPFAPGARFPVSQGYHGRYTHHGASAYAVDFAMPTGTPIHAARAGRVVAFSHSSDHGSPIGLHQAEDNYVWIEHDDGTIGAYHHLLKGSVAVKVGQQVAAGQRIARSGNTGRSSGPHLHFHVSTPITSMYWGLWTPTIVYKTFPTRFQTARGVLDELIEGETYAALPVN